MGKDLYTLLGVTPDADAAQLSRAYRRLVRTLHPDTATAGSEAAPERLTQVVAAYRILHDPAERAAYDRARVRTVTHDDPGPTGPTGPTPRTIRVGPPIRLG
ncbi:MAG: DnaJ domain-containing protein [Catenulisporales bacterium]|jgi:DnaJ-class molecular chaperone|nr:DnaJ domain-containing protein [Catenulisporales bacterium]